MIYTGNIRNSLKKLKPFFNLSLNNLEDFICVILGVFVLGIVVLRAWSYDITYDEAYTYMNTGRIQDFWKMYQFRIANTHVLNSLMMTVSTLFFPYNDFAIRLPNVLMSIIYVSIAFSISKKYKNRLLTFGLLILFHFMLEFMAQGRGYGISATFILAALYVYQSKDKFQNFHLWIAYLLILSFYANYVAIAPATALILYLFFKDFKRKIPAISKKNKRWITGLVVLGLYGFFSVSLDGKPLFGAYHAGFFEAIPYTYNKLFSPNIRMSLSVVTTLTLAYVSIVIVLIFLKKAMPYGTIALITFSIIVFMAFIANKPLPTGRVLIPFWPIIVFSMMEMLEKASLKFRIPNFVLRSIGVLIMIPLVYNVYRQIGANELLSAKSEQWKIPISSLAQYGEDLDPDYIYYIQKDNQHHIISKKIESLSFVQEQHNGILVRTYDEIDLVEIEFPQPTWDQLVYREVFEGNLSVYSDTLSLDTESMLYQETEMGMRLLIPYTNIKASRLQIGDGTGKWETDIDLKN